MDKKATTQVVPIKQTLHDEYTSSSASAVNGPSKPKILKLTPINKKFISPSAKINRINAMPFQPNQRPNDKTVIENRTTRAVTLSIELLAGVTIMKNPSVSAVQTLPDNNTTTNDKLPSIPVSLKPKTIHHCCSKCGNALDNFSEFIARLKGFASDVHFNFKCRHCALETTRWQQYFESLSTKPAPLFRYVCSFCAKKFSHAFELWTHATAAHSESYTQRFECVCCLCTEPVECRTIEELEYHHMEWHTHFDDNAAERLYACAFAFCRLNGMKTLADAVAHRADHDNYPCVRCPPKRCTLRTFDHWKGHMLVKHWNSDPSTTNVLCDDCGKCFISLSCMLMHRKKKHERKLRKTHDCEICLKQFSSRSLCERHRLTHTDSRPYKCDLCTRTYRDKTDLRRHKRVHGIGEKNIKCDWCNKRFYENKALRCHVQIHHK